MGEKEAVKEQTLMEKLRSLPPEKLAEVIAEWGHVGADTEMPDTTEEEPSPETETEVETLFKQWRKQAQ